ncbi:FixH family protein [Andreprevotia chitinilytica]|uniref:FixH family protein n=1 Tax=Andreprevotia chitinilytica TaxID=396808 RepID=UPI00055406EE|nr:FixH family protein [Andreprevotia chitinilytica]
MPIAIPTPSPAHPWYKMFWPWFLMALPAVAVVASLYTFYIAVRTSDGLVDDDYYRDGQAINQELGRDKAATAMGISAQVILSEDGRNIRVLLNKAADGTLQLDLLHPTMAGQDSHLKLQSEGPMLYSGQLVKPLSPTHWDVELGDTANHWRLRGQWQVGNGEPLQLQSH